MQIDAITRVATQLPERCWRCGHGLEDVPWCPHCGARNGSVARPNNVTERRCERCGRLLLLMHAFNGRVEIQCQRCKTMNVICASEPDRKVAEQLERVTDERRRLSAQPGPPAMTTDDLLALMEARWDAYVSERGRRRLNVAVGIRFDVLKRDGFRCRYCGLSVDEGAILHVDHVVARSLGGANTLDNLVTACVECNLGKSDKPL